MKLFEHKCNVPRFITGVILVQSMLRNFIDSVVILKSESMIVELIWVPEG